MSPPPSSCIPPPSHLHKVHFVHQSLFFCHKDPSVFPFCVFISFFGLFSCAVFNRLQWSGRSCGCNPIVSGNMQLFQRFHAIKIPFVCYVEHEAFDHSAERIHFTVSIVHNGFPTSSSHKHWRCVSPCVLLLQGARCLAWVKWCQLCRQITVGERLRSSGRRGGPAASVVGCPW